MPQCVCGSLVDSSGIHGLSCTKSSARIPRHASLNDLIHRSFTSASIPAVKEPTGLIRSDGKRPDGVTQIPWQSGKCLSWDVTVTDTLAPSYVHLSALSAANAAENAASKKVAKYALIMNNYDFSPIAFETLGPINSSGQALIEQLGRRMSTVSGDPREGAFLFQRLSITMQRYNALAIRGTFEDLALHE